MNAAPVMGRAEAVVRDYEMRDSLSGFCLPQNSRDPMRKVAWTNALCLCVLAGGLIGVQRVKQLPVFVSKPPPPPPVVEEVIKNTPVPPVQPVSEVRESEPNEPPPMEVTAAPVVAALMTADIPFAVEVKGVQSITLNASEATLLPRTIQAAKADTPTVVEQPPTRETIRMGSSGSGVFPRLTEFPPEAKAKNIEGRVVIEYAIELSGEITELRVGKSSGHAILDEYARNWVRKQFKPASSPHRRLIQTPFNFVLENRK